MYRILIARNGFYYAQKLSRFGYFRISPFVRTRLSARRYITDDKAARRPRELSFNINNPNVVEYIR